MRSATMLGKLYSRNERCLPVPAYSGNTNNKVSPPNVHNDATSTVSMSPSSVFYDNTQRIMA